MERVFIFSDVHANRLALSLAYEQALKHNFTSAWFLGDALGYGPWPIPTMDLLFDILGKPGEDARNAWLAGNHDWALVRRGIGNSFHGINDSPIQQRLSAYAEKSIEKHRLEIEGHDANILDYFENMSVCQPAPIDRIFLAHGYYTNSTDTEKLIDSVWAYPSSTIVVEQGVYEAEYPAWVEQAGEKNVLYCAGHYHVPALWRRVLNEPNTNLDPALRARTCWEKLDWDEQWIDLELGYFYHLNPGSVGFPAANTDGRPSFALLEIENGTMRVRHERVDCDKYNVQIVRDELIKLNYPREIWKQRLANCYE